MTSICACGEVGAKEKSKNRSFNRNDTNTLEKHDYCFARNMNSFSSIDSHKDTKS